MRWDATAYRIDEKGLKKLEESLEENSYDQPETTRKPTLRDLENMMAARGGRVKILNKRKGKK